MRSVETGLRPTFLILGAYKAGTTSMHHYLKQHPQIFMSQIKEIRFLTYAGQNELPLSPYEIAYLDWKVQSLADYEKLFSGTNAFPARGDVSPCYLSFPVQTIRGIKKYTPKAKLIAILRHPADRAYSSFVYLVNIGREEEMSFRRSLQFEAKRKVRKINGLQRRDFIESFYFESLQHYFQSFPREQIKIYLYDDLQQNPVQLIQDIFRFIGVDDSFVPDMSVRHNPSGWPRFESASLFIRRAENFLIRAIRHLPKPVNGYAENQFKLLTRTKAPPLDPALRRDLIALYREDILRTQDLIKRDLSHWLR
ncbi:MAG: sulfotransferase [Syntrophaceae bacterium]|nr:sulfotransferase [Syntrophaceae bacterium]